MKLAVSMSIEVERLHGFLLPLSRTFDPLRVAVITGERIPWPIPLAVDPQSLFELFWSATQSFDPLSWLNDPFQAPPALAGLLMVLQPAPCVVSAAAGAGLGEVLCPAGGAAVSAPAREAVKAAAKMQMIASIFGLV